MSKYTPGPWAIKCRTPFGGGDAYFDGVVDADGREIRVEGVTLTSGPVARANARLIAAAPELLAFAKEFLSDYRSEDGMASMKHYAGRAHALIAQATGEQP